MVVLGLVRGSGRVQHDFGGGASLSGRVAAEDGSRVRTLELGGELYPLWSLPHSPALGNTELCPHRSVVHVPCLSFSEYMDVDRSPLCTECVLCLPGAWGRVGVSLALVPGLESCMSVVGGEAARSL